MKSLAELYYAVFQHAVFPCFAMQCNAMLYCALLLHNMLLLWCMYLITQYMPAELCFLAAGVGARQPEVLS